MKKFALILAALAVFTTQAHCFPDMELYPHQSKITEDGFSTAASLFKNAVKLKKVKSVDYSGYRGFCSLTGHYIYIDGYDECSVCLISNKYTGKEEISNSTLEYELDNGLIARDYYFDTGRLIIVVSETDCFAAWQSWRVE